MICFNKKNLFFLLIPLLILSSGCGYRIGTRSMMHPQIRSIAIGEVQNNTLEPLSAMILKQQIAECFQTDGGLDLKNLGEADCVAYAKITRIKNETLREDSIDYNITYRPAEFRITVMVEFSVVIPGRGKALVPTRTVSGYADYQILADPATSRANGLKQACFNAAKQLVEYTTEAW